jgi:acid phosphatase type 7
LRFGYWTLETPLATIIGLYTNIPDGGFLDHEQMGWLVGELKAAATDKALILAMHHSVYLENGAKGDLHDIVDAATSKAGRIPDVIFSAHANLYVRFSREISGRQVPYIIAGTGGYPHLKRVATQTIPDGDPNIKREYYDHAHHGFVRVTVTHPTILAEYFGASLSSGQESSPATPLDRVQLDWTTHRLSSTSR